MIPAPPSLRPDETTELAAARMDKVAADLSVFAEEHEARGRAYRDRAEEYRANAAGLRDGAK